MSQPDSRHLVDPQLLPLLEFLPTIAFSAEILPAIRSRPPWFQVSEADKARTDLTVRTVPGPAGAPEVEVWIYRPRGLEGRLPCIFHIHGGGYVAGNAAQNEGGHRPLAADLGCCIISVNYRLAPETPHPGPLDDCYAALAWVFAQADDLAIDPARLGLMGESAGGGLAAALALLVRDRGEFTLAFQHLIYPMLDDRTCITTDPHPYTGEFVWTAHNNHFGWSSLLGHEPGLEGVSPYVDLARTEDLSDRYIGRMIKLAYLAPAVLEKLLLQRCPLAVSLKDLTAVADLPWAEQVDAAFNPAVDRA